LEIARLMEQADDPSDAMHLYRVILRRHPSLQEALEGAGRTAFQMGRYLEAKKYLGRALEGPGADQEPLTVVQQNRERLSDATRLLLLYPSSRLSIHERGSRILNDRKLALARLAECRQDKASMPAKDSALVTPPASKSSSISNPLANLASRFTNRSSKPAESPAAAAPPADPLQALVERWQQLPVRLTLAELEKDPELAQAQIQLIYDTELITQQVCGAPAGDNALLLRIAQAPNLVEEE
jgi:tetratricopeptide (TPR) repeat protein